MKFIYEEPVRGSVPPEGFHALPGIERVRALVQGLVPPPPLHHLFGGRVTSFSVGSAVMIVPASPWATHANTLITGGAPADSAMTMAALTRLPAGVAPQLVSLDIHHRKVATPADRHLVIRAAVTSANDLLVSVHAEIENGDGRGVASALGSFLAVPACPDGTEPLKLTEPVDLPRYPTEDPYRRPFPAEFRRDWDLYLDDPMAAAGARGAGGVQTAIGVMIGQTLGELTERRADGQLRTNEWLCLGSPHVAPGMLATFMGEVGVPIGALAANAWSWGGQTSFRFIEPLPADGRTVVCQAELVTRSASPGVVNGEVRGEDGTLFATLVIAGVPFSQEALPNPAPASRRMLMTVLFTDIVNSTAEAARLGDEEWSKLRSRHDGIVGDAIEAHGGRQIKHTGDGVLATFDAPSSAVECARQIASAVTEAGVQIRAGLHTGEVDVTGHDVHGTAVNTAARVEAAAGPGEVWVSETTKALTAGSGLSFADMGEHDLKGLDEPLRLYRVD